jgi:phenylacetate-CoA ligase
MMPGVYTRFCSSTLFPLHERLKRHATVTVRQEMELTQWLAPRALEAMRISRLREFMTSAGRRSAYYRELFARHGLIPEQLDSLAHLARLPLLTKDIIRAEFDRIKFSDATNFRTFSTTGSTGDPLRFGITSTRVTHDVAAKWRATRWWDVDIGDKEMVIWSSPIELNRQDRLRAMRDRLFRVRLVPSAAMSPADMDRHLDAIGQFRPRMLFGYPSAMTLLAQRAESTRRRLDELGIKVAFCTAERLYPHQTAVISRVFGCPVANGYGGRDSGFIAHQCPAGGLHLTAEDILVEIVGTDGQPLSAGEFGEIVVTHLFSDGFPFIRYRTGDMGILDDQACVCGRTLPLLKEIRGRTNDMLVAQDGSVVHDVAFAMVLRDMPGVDGFKIIQETLDECCLQLVTSQQFQRTSSEARIREVFAQRLGAGVMVQMDYVSAIEPERSGKYRYVVSKVHQTMNHAAERVTIAN